MGLRISKIERELRDTAHRTDFQLQILIITQTFYVSAYPFSRQLSLSCPGEGWSGARRRILTLCVPFMRLFQLFLCIFYSSRVVSRHFCFVASFFWVRSVVFGGRTAHSRTPPSRPGIGRKLACSVTVSKLPNLPDTGKKTCQLDS